MLPRHALSSIMVWNAGVGPWWAAISWTPAPAPRTPLIMLLILCPTIVVGEASRGATF